MLGHFLPDLKVDKADKKRFRKLLLVRLNGVVQFLAIKKLSSRCHVSFYNISVVW